jgi:hypothetical protein
MIDLILPRRQFLAGLAAALAAPAIMRIDSIMKLPRPSVFWQTIRIERGDGKTIKVTMSVPATGSRLGGEITIPSWGTGKVTEVINEVRL